MDNFYNSAFFDMLEKFRDEYKVIGNWIAHNFDFISAIDFGCGSGFLVEHLCKIHDKNIFGYDISQEGIDILNNRVGEKRGFAKDLTKPVHSKDVDLAICIEVAEHIEGKYSNVLVDNIISCNPKTIIFTAATIGQKGRNHINCQPHEYWIERFENRNYNLNLNLVNKFKKDVDKQIKHSRWLLNNMMIFEYED